MATPTDTEAQELRGEIAALAKEVSDIARSASEGPRTHACRSRHCRAGSSDPWRVLMDLYARYSKPETMRRSRRD